MALLLRNSEIAGLLTADEVRAAVQEGFVEQGENQVQLPPRSTTDSIAGLGWLRLMPAILNRSKIMGFKAMHSTPGVGVRYVVMLYDMPSGELLALIDADWLTSQRTSATAAVGIELLANPEIAVAGVLGSSEQARAMLTAAARVRALPLVKVFSPTADNRRRFAETMGRSLNLNIVPVDTAEEAVSDSDLVLSIFRAGKTPLVEPDWVKPGAHVTASSSVRPEARELMDGVWSRCSVVAVDDKAHALESGDGRSATEAGNLDPEKLVGIWEVLNNTHPGRQRTDDITLFKAVGTGLQDLALAAAVYARAKQNGIGLDVGPFPGVRN